MNIVSKISEVCSCGAKFYYSTLSGDKCRIAAMIWRKDHIHESPKHKDDHAQHETQLDSYVERADHTDANPAAELDQRIRPGFQWIENPLKQKDEI